MDAYSASSYLRVRASPAKANNDAASFRAKANHAIYDSTMNRARQSLRVAMLLGAATVLLSGCAPTSVGIETTDYAPPRAGSQLPHAPSAFTEDGLLFIMLAGSTSCPTVPTSIDVEDDGRLLVSVDSGWCLLSTADGRLRVYQLPVENIPNELTLVGENGSEVTLIVASTEPDDD